MGRYSGQSFGIICGRKGIDNNLNINNVEPDALIWPSKNIDLSKGGWGRRGGTFKVNEAAVTDAPRIMGIYDYLKTGGSQHIVLCTNDGKIYRTSSIAIKTGLGTDKYSHLEVFDNKLFICNGYDSPETWDGDAGATVALSLGVQAQGTITMSGVPVEGVQSQGLLTLNGNPGVGVQAQGEISISGLPTKGVQAQGTITMSGVPTGGVRSQGTITMSGVPTADETFLIDDQTFTWKVLRAAAGEVTIGADAAGCITNIVTAVTADLATVTIADGAGDTAVITAVTSGVAGNAIVLTEASANMAVDGAGTLGTTTAGVDGETFLIDTQTFTWETERQNLGEITVGANAAICVDNIVVAVTSDMDTVIAADGAGDTVIITVLASGTAGNSIVFTEAATNMAVDGAGTLGTTTAGVAGDTIVIGTQTYTWETERQLTGDVEVGTSAALCVTNLVLAIMVDSDVVTAEDDSGVVVTAVDYGVDGNVIVFTEDSSNLTINGNGTLGGTTAGINEEYFTLDDQVFTFKEERATTGEVTIGTDAPETIDNILVAIAADLDTVTAEEGDSDTVTFTAVAPGIAGDEIVLTETSGNLTVDGTGTLGTEAAGVDEETFTIDEQTFTWKDERSSDEEDETVGLGEVTIGADASECVTNIVDAVTADITIVTAEDGDGDTVVLTAADKGVAGNEIIFTEAATNMAVDGSDVLGGTTAGVADQIPSDWTGHNFPSVMLRHGKGNSERMWAFGCTSNPYTIYVSPTADALDFSDTNVLTLNLDTGDNTGIVGGVVFKDNILLFGKRATFIIDDADTNTDNWGYTEFAKVGGAAHQRLIIPTPNDVILMMEDGEIYSLVASEQYGDYKAASITKGKYIDRWISDNVRMSYMESFHGIYDPVKRVVRIFVVRKAQTEVDTALVYHIDTGEWMVEDNIVNVSGYSASASAIVKVSTGVYKTYTGGYSGFVWQLDHTAHSDAGLGYESKALMPPWYLGNPRIDKHYHKGWVDLEPDTTYELSIRYYIGNIFSHTVSMAGDTATLGTFTLGVDVLGTQYITRIPFRIGRIGEKIQFEISNSTVDEDFFVTQILLDFKPLGGQQD